MALLSMVEAQVEAPVRALVRALVQARQQGTLRMPRLLLLLQRLQQCWRHQPTASFCAKTAPI